MDTQADGLRRTHMSEGKLIHAVALMNDRGRK